jgi:cell division transport system permease protein
MARPVTPSGTRPGARRLDGLGLQHAPGWRVLPLIVAGMAFLAALALAGAQGAAELGRHWQQGAGATLTIQVPRPAAAPTPPVAAGETRRDRVVTLLRGTPGIASVRPLTEAELSDLLRPWLGTSAEQLALPLPGVVAVTVTAGGPDLPALAARLEAAAPGTLTESHGPWVRRLDLLARSLRLCALAALGLVAAVAAGLIVVATRAALASRRQVVEILHGLGATDFYVADRFARRASRAAALGGVVGLALALPIIAVLAALAAPFVSAVPLEAALPGPADLAASIARLPPALLWALPAVPVSAALIGYVAAQLAVRAWLRRLP